MKTVAITAALALLLGIGLGSQLFPKTKTEIVETEKEVIKKDVVTVVKEIIRPDGSKEVVTTTTDKSKEKKSSSSTTKVLASNYHVSLKAETGNIKFSELVYSVQVEKRIIGDLFIGASISTNKQVGLSLGIEF